MKIKLGDIIARRTYEGTYYRRYLIFNIKGNDYYGISIGYGYYEETEGSTKFKFWDLIQLYCMVLFKRRPAKVVVEAPFSRIPPTVKRGIIKGIFYAGKIIIE